MFPGLASAFLTFLFFFLLFLIWPLPIQKKWVTMPASEKRHPDEIFRDFEPINSSHRFYGLMALGDLAFEETGKFAGVRALPEGKVEATYQGTGKLFGADYSSIYTGVATPHGGTLIAEFNGICTTKDGDTVGVWAHGRGRPTGSGLKASWRGGVIWQASSPKFARLNNVPGVWELDIDEGGNFHLKVWEWK